MYICIFVCTYTYLFRSILFIVNILLMHAHCIVNKEYCTDFMTMTGPWFSINSINSLGLHFYKLFSKRKQFVRIMSGLIYKPNGK